MRISPSTYGGDDDGMVSGYATEEEGRKGPYAKKD